MRDTTDPIEIIGIERTRAAIADADLALVLVESDADVPDRLLAELPLRLPRIIVRNKIDLADREPHADDRGVWLSATTGDGVDLLIDAITATVGFNYREEGGFMARERHVTALRAALSHLDGAVTHLDYIALELFAEELRLAHQALGAITGEFTADDLLGEIFSRFCIGK